MNMRSVHLKRSQPRPRRSVSFRIGLKNLDPRSIQSGDVCTGGIRCEKSTSYLLEQGFEEVYHLKGGVLNYLIECPPPRASGRANALFLITVTVNHKLEPGEFDQCQACRRP